MERVRVLEDTNEDGSPVFSEGYKKGDIVDLRDASLLIREGKVEPTPEEPYPRKATPKDLKALEQRFGVAEKKEEQEQEEESHVCDVCGFEAKAKIGLMSHKRAKHNKVK